MRETTSNPRYKLVQNPRKFALPIIHFVVPQGFPLLRCEMLSISFVQHARSIFPSLLLSHRLTQITQI